MTKPWVSPTFRKASLSKSMACYTQIMHRTVRCATLATAYGDGGVGLAKRDDDWALAHQGESVPYEQDGYAGDFRTDETPHKGPIEHGSQEIAPGIGDHHLLSMAGDDKGDDCRSQKVGANARNTLVDPAPTLNRSEVTDLTNLGVDDESSDDSERGGEGSRRLQGPRSSKALQGVRISTQPASVGSPSLSPSSSNTQAEETMPHDDPLFVMDTSISSSDQPLQKASSHAIQDSMVDTQRPRSSQQASDQGDFETLNLSSRSNDDSESDHDEDENHNYNRRMSGEFFGRKRKRDASVNASGRKRYNRASNEMSEEQSTDAAHAPTQRERDFSLRPPESPQEVRSCSDVAEVQADEHTGPKSSDSARHDALTCSPNTKELQGLEGTDINHINASDDTEYEVERILAVRLRRGRTLQYRVQWLGYEADSEWYNASNFKNSPHKLREFHEATPANPGPPARLSHWETCWEEDREADDYFDDDKPQSTAHRGRRAVKLS